MDKFQQKELLHWLKKQAVSSVYWFRWLTLLTLLNAMVLIAQGWLLAYCLHQLIIEHAVIYQLQTQLWLFFSTFVIKAILVWLRENISFRYASEIRQNIRRQILDRLTLLGPVAIGVKPIGNWVTMILEQVENMHDFYARYLPQIMSTMIIPVFILFAVYSENWAAGIILTFTAPLIPLFMIITGLGAAEANRRNFQALSQLSGLFLDRLRGLDTLRLFFRASAETENIFRATELFRQRTMNVLKMAFLSSGVLEFFSSISIALVAVYFGFSYLGALQFGNYNLPITLFSGFFVLILSPEFFQPLRELGTFYHAKAQAIGAAESIFGFLQQTSNQSEQNLSQLKIDQINQIKAEKLIILSHDQQIIAGPLDFTIEKNHRVAIVGHSGSGKSSLLNVLLGFQSYQGSLTINGIELKELNLESWWQKLSWLGQTPYLPATTIRENIVLREPNCSEARLQSVIEASFVKEFLVKLPDGLETVVQDDATRLSVGQAQRIAVARALLSPCQLLLLDEPCSNLDAISERLVMNTLNQFTQKQTTILVTHRLEETENNDLILVMDNGSIVQQGNYQTLSHADGLFKSLLAVYRGSN